MASQTPTAEQKRQRLLLAVLIVLVLFVAYRQMGGWFSFGGDTYLRGQRTADFASVLDTEIEALSIERLESQAQEVEVGRSPWEYGKPPAPPPVVREPRQPITRPRPQPKPKPTPTGPPPPPPPPAIDVEFLGSLGPERRKVAVFGKDELVINALVGDLVNEKFRVHAIGLESVDLTFEGFPDVAPKRLPLKAKKK